MSIDWKAFAKLNNMTPEEFEHEIFLVAVSLGSMKIDNDEADTLEFTCSDEIGELKMYIRRMPS